MIVMSSVRLRNLPRLEVALLSHEKEMKKAVEGGMVVAARRGVAVATRSMSTFSKRPRASGTYGKAWLSVPISGGAAVSNSARHSIFVERGRLPGRAPPLAPILEWVYQKRIVKRSKGKSARGQAGSARTARAKAIAMLIVQKIKRKGIEARPVLGRSMPSITKFAIRESKKAVSRVNRNPPR